MDETLRNKIEAVLFSIGKKIHIDELMRMIKDKDKARVVACLIELKKKYNEDVNNSLQIMQDGDDWKLTIKDQYIDVAKEIGIETELPKTVMETLAVIAYKNPVLQSEVIKIRTNKAYDHLKLLEEMGYIQREKYGRTKKIKLATKFFQYFDLPPEALKEKFSNVAEMEKIIKQKENQIHEITEKKKEMIEKQREYEIKQEKRNIYMEKDVSPTQEIIQHDEKGMDIIKGEKFGKLEVFDEPKEDNDNNNQQKHELGKPTGEKLGDLDIIEETDEENNNEDEKSESSNQEDLPDESLEPIKKNDEEINDKEKEIIDIQDLKDKINEELSSMDNENIDEKEEINEEEESRNEDNIDEKEEDMDKKESDDDNKNNEDENINQKDMDEQENGDEEERENEGSGDEEERENEDNIDEKEEDMDKKESDDDNKNNEDENINQKDMDEQESGDEEERENEGSGDEEDNINDEDNINEKEEDNGIRPLKESELFQMEGIPEKIMKQIKIKSEEITGEKKNKDNEDLNIE
jgi:segregation and condensation protein B